VCELIVSVRITEITCLNPEQRAQSAETEPYLLSHNPYVGASTARYKALYVVLHLLGGFLVLAGHV